MTAWDAALTRIPLIAVIRHDDDDAAWAMAVAAVHGGIETIEITFTVPSAPRLIERLRREHPHVIAGAGTVLTRADVDAAVDAGASFLVSPVIDEDVIGHAVDSDAIIVPGAATPSEVARAAALGAAAVKLFPASSLGPAFVSAVRDVLPAVRLIPTGGIGPGDVGDWLSRGAAAVGIAGALTRAWATGGGDAVSDVARSAVVSAQPVRSPL